MLDGSLFCSLTVHWVIMPNSFPPTLLGGRFSYGNTLLCWESYNYIILYDLF